MIYCGCVLLEGFMVFFINKMMGVFYVCYVYGEDLEVSVLLCELNSFMKMVMWSVVKIICNSYNSVGIVEWVDNSVRFKVVVMYLGVDINKFVLLV